MHQTHDTDRLSCCERFEVVGGVLAVLLVCADDVMQFVGGIKGCGPGGHGLQAVDMPCTIGSRLSHLHTLLQAHISAGT